MKIPIQPENDPDCCSWCVYFSGAECERFPPVPVWTNSGLVSCYPKVIGGNWCGEFSTVIPAEKNKPILQYLSNPTKD